MKHKFNKSMSTALLKERLKEMTAEDNNEKTVIDLGLHKQKTEVNNNYNIVKLSPFEYKRHVRAKKVLIKTIGVTSEKLYRKEITRDDFDQLQIGGAKLAIRTFNLSVVLTAWKELVPQIMALPGRQSKGIPIRCQPMSDYFSNYTFEKPLIDLDIFDSPTLEMKEASHE